MTKILVRVCLILILLLVIAYTYIGLSVWKHGKDEEVLRQKVDLVLKGKYPSAELVTGVGIYQVLKYGPDDMPKEKPVLIRGVVKMGIDINKLKVDHSPGRVVITYPEIKILAVEILNLVDMSGEMTGTQFFKEVLAMQRLFLKNEAKRQGLMERAERNLRSEINYMISELAPDSLVVVQGRQGLKVRGGKR